MLGAERLAVTMNGGTPDRVPVMPKIWVNVAARLTGIELADVIEDPRTAMQVVIDAARLIGIDGARLFLFPARRIQRENGSLIEVDESGRRLGEIDMEGGLATRLDRGDDFCIEDPYHLAFRTSWSHETPFLQSEADVARMAVPDKSFYEAHGYGDLAREMLAHAGDEVGLAGDCDSATLAFCVSLRGMTQALLDMIDSPELVHRLMEKGTTYAVERGKFLIDCGLRILRLNDSVGNMSVISPRLWKEFVYPHMKEVCDELHGYCPEAKVYCHVCGNLLPIVEGLVETGLDCIAPLDPLGGFTVADVRQRVGERYVLMGGVDTMSFVRSSPEQIRAEALRCIEEGDRSGGFVLGSGCALPGDTKRENLEALVEAARGGVR
jgi:uroporphyrinogen-III decarboxylase